jgi:hypothetical protein
MMFPNGRSFYNVRVPKQLYRGEWNEARVREIEIDIEICEGYVVRLVDSFDYESFGKSVGKWVRPHHVQTDEDWMHKPLVLNKIKERR